MPRAPFQVLVLPFRRDEDRFEFALFHRADLGVWQGLSGGGEGAETPAEAARREAREEAGVLNDAPLYALDSRASIPVTHFHAPHWPEALLVIPEYTFALDATHLTLTLSSEHDTMCWDHAEAQQARLKWDSNQIALWELHQRLTRGLLTSRRVM